MSKNLTAVMALAALFAAGGSRARKKPRQLAIQKSDTRTPKSNA